MKVIEHQYTALRLVEKKINDEAAVELSAGKSEWNYTYLNTPDLTHDSRDEAIQHAYKHGPHDKWLIFPVVEFDNQ